MQGVRVVPVGTLAELVPHLRGDLHPAPVPWRDGPAADPPAPPAHRAD